MRSKTAHSVRTKPSIELTASAATRASHHGSASPSRSRTSPIPGSVETPTTTTTSTTTKNAMRLAIARPSMRVSGGEVGMHAVVHQRRLRQAVAEQRPELHRVARAERDHRAGAERAEAVAVGQPVGVERDAADLAARSQ